MDTSPKSFWIGQFSDGEIVVFDPERQERKGDEWVCLWSYTTGKTERYFKSMARTAIAMLEDRARWSEILEAYRKNGPCASVIERMVLHPQGINGPWKTGIVLDWHTVASQVVGENEFGNPSFDNTRSEIGELLYQFKYRNDQKALQPIVHAAIQYLGDKVKGRIDVILPIPPSNPKRTVTSQIAEGLADGLRVGLSRTALTKSKSSNELKSVTDPEERRRLLEGAFSADKQQLEGKSVLLVDDIYRSGATLSAATEVVTDQGKAKVVYVLAITRTRVNR